MVFLLYMQGLLVTRFNGIGFEMELIGLLLVKKDVCDYLHIHKEDIYAQN